MQDTEEEDGRSDEPGQDESLISTDELVKLANELTRRAELLAPAYARQDRRRRANGTTFAGQPETGGGSELYERTRRALKLAFDQGEACTPQSPFRLADKARPRLTALASEEQTFTHLTDFLASLSPDDDGAGTLASSRRTTTRSRSRAQQLEQQSLASLSAQQAAERKSALLPRTPLDELTLLRDDRQAGDEDRWAVWHQLELRHANVCKALELVFKEEAADQDDDDDADDMDDDGMDDLLDDQQGVSGEQDEDDKDGDLDAMLADDDALAAAADAEQGDYFFSDDDDDDESESGSDAILDDDDDDEGGQDTDEALKAEEEFRDQEPYYQALTAAADDSSPPPMADDDDDDDEVEEVVSGKGGKKSRVAAPAKRYVTRLASRPSLGTQADVNSARTSHRGKRSEVDDDFFSLDDFHREAEEGEIKFARALRNESPSDEEGQDDDDDVDLFGDVQAGGEGDSEEEADLDDANDVGGIMFADFFDAPPRGAAGRHGPPRPSLSERPPAQKKDKRARQNDDAGGSSAKDEPAVDKKRRRVSFNDAVKVKNIPARPGAEFDRLIDEIGLDQARDALVDAHGQDALENFEDRLQGDSDEEDEEMELGEEEEADDDDEDEDSLEDGVEAIERAKTDLLDDDDEDDDSMDGDEDELNMTKHERRQRILAEQIAALEAENVGERGWATRGEVKSKQRPVNSLLEEDLEFERAGKVVPVQTEETTRTIEDIIKRRILDHNFDDVERRREIEPNAFLPSRFMDLLDQQSDKSLAQVYEDEFTQAREREQGRQVTHQVDQELEDRHAEIESLFNDLSGKLDALSNAHYTPKAPKGTISTVSNLPAISVESALPTSTSAATMLAPEEVYTPDPTKEDRSDFTPAQKRAARQKRRKARASIAKAAEKFTKPGAAGEKERALKQLAGTKGVTVIGKGGSKDGKAAKPNREPDTRPGAAFKL